MQTCNCCVHSCSPLRWRIPKSRQNSRSAQKRTLYSNLLQSIFSHKLFYLMVNRQYSGQDQMRALSLVWVRVASLRLCSAPLRVAEPVPARAGDGLGLSCLPACLSKPRSPGERLPLTVCLYSTYCQGNSWNKGKLRQKRQ